MQGMHCICMPSHLAKNVIIIQISTCKNLKQNLIKLPQLQVFTFKPIVPNSVRKTELELAVCIGCLTSMLAIDHLGEVIKENGTGSNEINLHRTKCSQLIDCVIVPSLNEELKHGLKG